MSELFTIKDGRTVYCRAAMKANGGQWNAVTETWMFRDAGDQGNAAAELYRVTRPSTAMCEALQAMVIDGTGALAWDFDPAERPLLIDDLDRGEASKMLAAGYAVRRVLGVHPLEDDASPPSDEAVFDATPFEERRSHRRRPPNAA
ncbi:MAG: hypothetical protein ABI231_03920 [Candidatus Tumulicola sp.]